MRVLVIGSGGREHALVWKIAQSSRVTDILCAPGNGGIADLATCIDCQPTDFEGLARIAHDQRVDLTLVGPELPLSLGIVDFFEREGLRIFGPSRGAAQIEGSKVFSKNLLRSYGIPTADYRTFSDRETATAYIREKGPPIVVKADGLAAGKGVFVAQTMDEALGALDRIMLHKEFGGAGNTVVIEEFLEGEEASFIAFSDGERILPLASSQDHKPIYDDDKGPNTGGMGAYSPAPVVTPEVHQRIMNEVMRPTVKALAQQGYPYRGILYAGLMIRDGIPKALEFNCRFGDPETQPIVVRMTGDLVAVIEACIEGDLSRVSLEWDNRPAVCVVMASGGYPGSYDKGKIITGLESVQRIKDVYTFHAGTALWNGSYVTAGGRVLGVTGLGNTVREAIATAYRAVSMVQWEGVHYRRDIGAKALARLKE